MLVCLGYDNKISQIGSLKQQKFIFSQFWRLEVQVQCIFLGFLKIIHLGFV